MCLMVGWPESIYSSTFQNECSMAGMVIPLITLATDRNLELPIAHLPRTMRFSSRRDFPFKTETVGHAAHSLRKPGKSQASGLSGSPYIDHCTV